MDRATRLKLFDKVADHFFAGSEWLAGTTGIPGVALTALAGLVRLVVQQAEARWEAVLDQPIGLPPSGYDVPGSNEVVRWFGENPKPPELATQFAAEIAARDVVALRKAHRILTEVLDFDRPLLKLAFEAELAVKDYRAIVEKYEGVKRAVDTFTRDPKTQGLLRRWFDLLTGQGPESSDAEARATLIANWEALLDVALEALS